MDCTVPIMDRRVRRSTAGPIITYTFTRIDLGRTVLMTQVG